MAGASSRSFSDLLTPLQEHIATIVESLPEARGFALAGAGGLTVRGLIERPTQDLDYFTVPGEEDAVVGLRNALEETLRGSGLVCVRQRDLPTFVRLAVTDGDESCQVDLAIDYRALPPEPSIYGPTLAAKELAAGKVLALFDRAEARDFLDVAALVEHFTLEEMMELAAEKDRGFATTHFLEALATFRRFTPADLGISEAEYEPLRMTVESWRRHLGRNIDREPPEPGPGPSS